MYTPYKELKIPAKFIDGILKDIKHENATICAMVSEIDNDGLVHLDIFDYSDGRKIEFICHDECISGNNIDEIEQLKSVMKDFIENNKPNETLDSSKEDHMEPAGKCENEEQNKELNSEIEDKKVCNDRNDEDSATKFFADVIPCEIFGNHNHIDILTNDNEATLSDREMYTNISYIFNGGIAYASSHYEAPVLIGNIMNAGYNVYTDGKLAVSDGVAAIQNYSAIVVHDKRTNRMHITVSKHASIETLKKIFIKIYNCAFDNITVIR